MDQQGLVDAVDYEAPAKQVPRVDGKKKRKFRKSTPPLLKSQLQVTATVDCSPVQQSPRDDASALLLGKVISDSEESKLRTSSISFGSCSSKIVSGESDLTLSELEGDTPTHKLLDLLLFHSFTLDLVSELLEKNADVNASWSSDEINGTGRAYSHVFGLTLSQVSPLALAVMHENLDLVSLLVEHGADLNKQRYSFVAGVRRVEWTGQPIVLPCVLGDLDLMMSLVEYKADLHARSSNGANLVWQAAHSGHFHIFQFLIQKGVRFDDPATNYDLNEDLYPLHIAARVGRLNFLQYMADHAADLNVTSNTGRTALDHAVNESQASAVYFLVQRGARLVEMSQSIRLRLSSSAELAIDQSFKYERTIDLLFNMNNSVVIEAAAKGLSDYEALRSVDEPSPAGRKVSVRGSQAAYLTRDDLLNFLKTPGLAPRYIISAMFRKTTLVYLDKLKQRRVRVNNAFLQNLMYTKMNVSAGQPWEEFDKMLRHKQYPDDTQVKFLNQLAPQQPRDHCSEMARVDIWQCMVKGMHADAQMMSLLSRAAEKDWYQDKSMQALSLNAWQDTSCFQTVIICLQVYHVLSWMALTIAINHDDRGRAPCMASVFTMLGLVYNVIEELIYMSVLGLSHYFGDWKSFLGLCRISLEIMSITGIWIAVSPEDSVEITKWMRFLIAVTVWAQWMKLLHELCSVASVGFQVLPIMRAVYGMGGICILSSFYLMAVVHAYYSMDYHSLWDSSVIMWSLGLFADIDYEKLENLEEGQHSGVFAQLLVISVTFSMALVIINISIGVLGEAYNRAIEKAWCIFLQERFRDSLKNGVVLRKLSECGLRPCCMRRREDDQEQFLYFCCDAAEDAAGSEAPVEKEHVPSLEKLMSDMQIQLSDMRRELSAVRTEISDLKGSPRSPAAERVKKSSTIKASLSGVSTNTSGYLLSTNTSGYLEIPMHQNSSRGTSRSRSSSGNR